MNASEQQLLEQEVGTTGIRMQLRTGTRIDVGLWWRRRRLWLVVTNDDLVLLAAGRRQYCERLPLSDCRGAFYNPASGELVIAPDNPPRFPRLHLPASTALDVIQQIQSTPNTRTP